MGLPNFPMNFVQVRLALVALVQQLTTRPCIVEERKGQNSMATPRPPLPYLSFKITTPAGKIGTDASQPTGTEASPSTVWNYGGVRRMTVSFKCYAESPEEAINYLALLEGYFDTDTVQQTLREKGLAFWQSLGVVDISSLLTTGYEGRASLDVYFGVPSILNIDLGEMDIVPVNGEVAVGSETISVNFIVPEES